MQEILLTVQLKGWLVVLESSGTGFEYIRELSFLAGGGPSLGGGGQYFLGWSKGGAKLL